MSFMRYSCLLFFNPTSMGYDHQVKSLVDGTCTIESRFHSFELVVGIYASAEPMAALAMRSVCDMTEHDVEMAHYTLGSRRLLFVLMLANHLSPQRFLGDPHLLPIVVRLHTKLVQFLRQYCELLCSLDETLASSDMRLPFSAADALLASFQSPSLRATVAPLFSRKSILSLIRPLPLDAPDEVAERARWLFAFCIATLNDNRLHEPSIEEYISLQMAVQKIAPLSSELLNSSSF